MNATSLASFRSTRGSLLLIAVAALALAACGGGTAKKAAGTGGGGGNSPTLDKCLADSATQDQVANIAGADIARGGRLYDAWFEEKNTAAPGNTNPMWAELPSDATSTATGDSTWRCKECHGWDYAGANGAYNKGNPDKYTGVMGLLDIAQEFGEADPAQIFCAIKSGVDATNGKHNFGAQMADEDILDLTKFVAEQGVINTSGYIASNMGTNGDTKSGSTLYKASCGSNGCHASTGTKNAGDETLGIIATENPWEFLHKVRFGDPTDSKSMYSFEQIDGLTPAQIVDIIAYAQATLEGGAGNAIQPDPPITGGGGTGTGGTGKFAGKVLGGRIFDNLFEVAGVDVTKLTTSNPLYLALTNKAETDFPTTDDKADTWRCSTCHGWDYKGQEGVNGSTNGAVPGLLQNVFAQMKIDDPTPTGLQNALESAYSYLKSGFNDPVKGVVHAFGTPIVAGASALSEVQLRALADFVVNGLVDSSKYVLNSRGQKQVLGDPVAGKALYDAAAGATGGGCGDAAACHGADGKAIDFHADEPAKGAEYLDTVAKDNPWETFHRISFGVAGDPSMPSAVANGMTTAQIVNMLGYAQCLPDPATTCSVP